MTHDTPIPVAAAILEDAGRILIARRGPGDPMAGRWELPGGKLEPGESPRDCLRRELQEELGIETAVGAFFGTSLHRYDHVAIRLLAYRVELVAGAIRPTVHDRCLWVPRQRLGEYDFCPADRPLVARLIHGAEGAAGLEAAEARP
jgi:8-oxo-dGTP diphosphatase